MIKMIFVFFCLLFSILLNAQESFSKKYDLPSYNCSLRGMKNIGKSLIIVIPNDSAGISSRAFQLKEMGERSGMAIEVKTESQLIADDYKQPIWVLGITGRFSDLNKLSIPVGKPDNGFKIGNYSFPDSLYGFSYISDSLQDPTRIATIGNSLEALVQINNKPSFGFEYVVLNNEVPEYIGNGLQLTDLTTIRKKHYTIRESKYYTFMVSRDLTEEQLMASKEKFKQYDDHAEAFVSKMKLEMPEEKILTYIHSDQSEIKYMSGFFDALCGGTVYGFVTGDEIHSWGFGGAVEHEANHHLFNRINKKAVTFLSEGIQKWYEYVNNSDLKQRGRNKAKEFVSEDLTNMIIGRGDFFQGDKYYLISGIFVDYLLEKYGLDKFKELYLFESLNIINGFEQTYKLPLAGILEDYKKWLVE